MGDIIEIINFGKYTIKIYDEDNYLSSSADSSLVYRKVFCAENSTTRYGVQIFSGDDQISSCLIGATGGATGMGPNTSTIHEDNYMICCSDSVFSLKIPELTLTWHAKADDATCFEIIQIKDGFIIHGELSISKLDFHGNVIWQNTGRDIFLTEKGEDDFTVTQDKIIAKDWDNNEYIFDFDGKALN